MFLVFLTKALPIAQFQKLCVKLVVDNPCSHLRGAVTVHNCMVEEEDTGATLNAAASSNDRRRNVSLHCTKDTEGHYRRLEEEGGDCLVTTKLVTRPESTNELIGDFLETLCQKCRTPLLIKHQASRRRGS
ncbi:hypothetical protein ACOSP7_021032 [Xanthoceras sorbifolium]